MILTVHYDCEQAVKQRLEALVTTGDDFVEDLNMKSKKEYLDNCCCIHSHNIRKYNRRKILTRNIRISLIVLDFLRSNIKYSLT